MDTSDNPAARRVVIKKPNLRFLFSHPAHWFALGFGSGNAWILPGTFGTLMGWLLYVWLDPHVDDWGWITLISLGYTAGIWFCSVAGRNLGVVDHGSIVWDEIIAIWLVLFVAADVYDTPMQQLVCVVVFRVFDMAKPPPIRWFDQHFKSGFGVMLDDIVAALMTLLALALLARFWEGVWL